MISPNATSPSVTSGDWLLEVDMISPGATSVTSGDWLVVSDTSLTPTCASYNPSNQTCMQWALSSTETTACCDYRHLYHTYALSGTHKSPKQQFMDILKSRHCPAILSTRKSVRAPSDHRELRARETLRRVIGDQKFKKFIRDGFVSVKAKSGLVYQIFPGHYMTNVYRDGERVEKLCVVLNGDFPPTDSLIMRYLLILNDEHDFRNHAISHAFTNIVTPRQTRFESLIDAWNRTQPHKPQLHGPQLQSVAA